MKKLDKSLIVLFFLIISISIVLVISLIVFFSKLNEKNIHVEASSFLSSVPSSHNLVLEEEKSETEEEEIIVVLLEEENNNNIIIISEPVAEEVVVEEQSENTRDTDNTEVMQPNESSATFEEFLKYYIKINRGANTLTVYERDNSGNYSVPIKAFACSTGTATPNSGTYPLTNYKAPWVPLFGNVYGQYGWQVTGHILLHSVPYTEMYNKSSLTYYNYDKLGTSASAGCIRLTVADAKWIYDNCEVGTIVEFYSDYNNPGPLGKPETQKISGSYNLRGWDPTDPDENNPWHHASISDNNHDATAVSKPATQYSPSNGISITIP